MFPILFSVGPISVYTAHVFAILAWGVFSFLFWKQLRSLGILEERIFDLTFYATLVGALFARIGFVILFPQLFLSSVLLIGAFWVQPGMWLYAGLLGVLLTFYILSKRYNILFSQVFDVFAYALPWTMIPLSLGTFFAGHEIGKVSTLPFSIVLPKVDGRRHPVQLYEIVIFILIGLLTTWLYKTAQYKKWPAGLIGSAILTLVAPSLFALEFLKDSSLYLYNISVNQWILILIFAESFGTLVIKLKRMGAFASKKGEKTNEQPAPEST